MLIADDSQDTRELYALYLSHCGFTVHTAIDGGEAVNMAVRLKPDAIVMDLTMPNVDGITAIQHLKLRPRTREIPIVMLTGYPAKAIDAGALEAGADVFLTKPCLPEELEERIRRVIEQRRERSPE